MLAKGAIPVPIENKYNRFPGINESRIKSPVDFLCNKIVSPG
ncbi:hypothetical protein FXW26_05450 [Candidatus Liberibacter asiaticus]|nr:hypothetical protein FXW32_05450 [Candidatus Liberibacter asiaticus]KAE9514929.1 hypothetical protein FXW26_05450 [Candidatus Liberibacter asiaticus]